MFRKLAVVFLIGSCVFLDAKDLKETVLKSSKKEQNTAFTPVSLSLEEAIRYAITHNLDFQSAFAGLEIATRQATAKRVSVYEPELQFAWGKSSSQSYSPIPPYTKFLSTSHTGSVAWRKTISGGNDVEIKYYTNTNTTYNKTGLDLTVSRALFGKSNTYFANEIAIDQKEIDREISFYRYIDTYQSLILNVVRAYLNTVKAFQQIEVSKSVLDYRKELLELTRVKFNLGVATRLDVLRVEVQVAQEEEGLIQARNNYENSLDSLLNLLNYERHEGEVQVSHHPVVEDFEMDEKKDVALALNSRPDLKIARLSYKKEELSLRNANEQVKNKIMLQGGVTKHGAGTAFSTAQDFDQKDWEIGLSYTHPLGNREDRENLMTQRVVLANSARTLKELENQVGVDVRTALRTLESTSKRLIVLEKNLERAKENLKLAKLSYEKGIKSSIEVLDAQDDLLDVNKNYINTQLDLQIAQFQLHRAMGEIDVPAEILEKAKEWYSVIGEEKK